ncbi:hypothetical protein P691DRAFT_783696 [Macrolepiota fuliginosa MF-IS2]|uniref:Uncharacterized protein n=1 Tax=Macrolepiota fuliginosa MF-IS2 TaxID=1400762 RepID=A0A9P5WZ81_9AGAR|nr:hypothetical protein P691DRAFT_783696 [Macrolepiota fuliginosa MF-IS2]
MMGVIIHGHGRGKTSAQSSYPFLPLLGVGLCEETPEARTTGTHVNFTSLGGAHAQNTFVANRLLVVHGHSALLGYCCPWIMSKSFVSLKLIDPHYHQNNFCKNKGAARRACLKRKWNSVTSLRGLKGRRMIQSRVRDLVSVVQVDIQAQTPSPTCQLIGRGKIFHYYHKAQKNRAYARAKATQGE